MSNKVPSATPLARRHAHSDLRPALVAIDLDGTLLTSDNQCSERSRQAVRALTARGVRVVLCTGRPPRLTRPLALELGLEPAIVYNGASTLYPTRNRCEHHHLLTREQAQAAIARLRAAAPEIMLGVETAHGWYLDEALYALRRPRLEAAGMPLPDDVGPVEAFVDRGVIKILARYPEARYPEAAADKGPPTGEPDTGDAAALARHLADLPLSTTWSGRRLLEVMHPHADKGRALARLAQSWKIPRQRVAAFGDEQNDLGMLRWAGRGIAMANGSDAARAAADEVTSSNDDDGVARVLERWLEAEATA